jgi:hypothetical protein
VGILDELSMLFRGRAREQRRVEPRSGAVPWQTAFQAQPEAPQPEPQQAPPQSDKVSVNYSGWTVFPDEQKFGRQWVIRGLGGSPGPVTVEIDVRMEQSIGNLGPPHRFVTMIVEPGFGNVDAFVVAQLAVDGKAVDAPFFTMQFRPVQGRDASIFAAVDKAGIDAMLKTLWQSEGMRLTMFANDKGDIALQASLYNDTSYRDVFNEVYDRVIAEK